MSDANCYPRRDSMAFAGLQTLFNIGGVATSDAWREAAGSVLTAYQFQTRVINVLKLHGLVDPGATHSITDAGRTTLGEPTLAKAPSFGDVAQPRTARPFSPMKSRSRSSMVYREGAFDYRQYPSLAGGQRIPYKADGNT
jgi:hypothetical protein